MTIDSFKKELKRVDKRLDIIWNKEKQVYQVIGIDRRGIIYIVQTIPLGKLSELGTHLIQAIVDLSPMKQGGAQEMNRRIDRLIAEESEQEEKVMQDTIAYASDEAFEHLARREGRRINSAGFIVNDKRRIYTCQ